MSDPILASLDAALASTEQSAKVKRASDLIPHVRVETPEGTDLVAMEAWPLTVELVDAFWLGNKRTVAIKARQLGVSWAFALYCLWKLGWHRHQTLGSINYNQDAASEMIRRMKVLWQTLPAAMRPEAKWTDGGVVFGNGSRGLALPTTDVGGAGLTFSIVGIDEAGLIKRLADNWAAILPAVEKGELHAFSTPREGPPEWRGALFWNVA